MGFSLYIDQLVEAGAGADERRRLFVPLGSDPAIAAGLRRAGWVTVAALDARDTAQAQLCTHILAAGEARPLCSPRVQVTAAGREASVANVAVNGPHWGDEGKGKIVERSKASRVGKEGVSTW